MHRRPATTRPVSAVVAVAMVALAAGCAATSESAPAATPGVLPTVAVGRLPEPLSGRPAPAEPPTTTSAATTTRATSPEAPVVTVEAPIGSQAAGNRVLVIGDSLMASTTRRHGGKMCEALNGFGWTVEVDAEPGRFVEFGHDVLDQRLRPDDGIDWDVVAIFLGNNLRGDLDDFAEELDGLVERVAPRPTILYTVSELDDDRSQLNDVIRSRPAEFPNVVVVDWAEVTETDPDQLLADDGLHLTEEGSGTLVLHTAGVLGAAPGDVDGRCLSSIFVDDSADGSAA